MTTPDEEKTCTQGWEALRGDSLPWLLDEQRPNLHWRALVELIGRPEDSPAVRRARGGANAAEPVASVIAELQPDGSWASDAAMWSRYDGVGWRVVAAMQWGADPGDPRLHAGSERILETAEGEGGLEWSGRRTPAPRLTARALEAMVALGWDGHARVQEWLAWFEATPEWEHDAVAAVAVLKACRGGLRPKLVERAVDGLDARLGDEPGGIPASLGYPNLQRTDLAEVFAALAAAGIEWRPAWRHTLGELQRRQRGLGRWNRRAPVPSSLGAPEPDQPSRWITLEATRALLTYAVDAGLPRYFPPPPAWLRDDA